MMRLVTDSTAEAVTLAQAKAHLRVATSDEDTHIGTLIAAARKAYEYEAGRALLAQTWDVYLDAFPAESCIRFDMAPLRSITSVTYRDENGTTATLGSTTYRADTSPERPSISLVDQETWPATQAGTNAVRVRAVFGEASSTEGSAGIPADDRAAIQLWVGQLYEHREPVVMGQAASAVPMTVDRLMRRFVRW